jgi:hypothetical protein
VGWRWVLPLAVHGKPQQLALASQHPPLCPVTFKLASCNEESRAEASKVTVARGLLILAMAKPWNMQLVVVPLLSHCPLEAESPGYTKTSSAWTPLLTKSASTRTAATIRLIPMTPIESQAFIRSWSAPKSPYRKLLLSRYASPSEARSISFQV